MAARSPQSSPQGVVPGFPWVPRGALGLTLRDPGLLLGGGGVRRRNTTGPRRGEDGWAIPEPGLRSAAVTPSVYDALRASPAGDHPDIRARRPCRLICGGSGPHPETAVNPRGEGFEASR